MSHAIVYKPWDDFEEKKTIGKGDTRDQAELNNQKIK